MTWEKDILQAFEKHVKEDTIDTTLYDSKFFQSLQKYRPLYHFLADMMVAHLKPITTSIDWGCGCGFILEKLQMHGITDLLGIEGSVEVEPFIPESLKDKIIIADALLYQLSKIYDLAISIEVAEHIPEKDAGKFVNAVCSSASKFVWWSAAQPGQKGTGHINCRDLCYWISVFKEVGLFEVDWEKTYELKSAMLVNHSLCLGFSWLRDNFLLFRRK